MEATTSPPHHPPSPALPLSRPSSLATATLTSSHAICTHEKAQEARSYYFRCRELFFVSETDILKALRYALYREVAFGGDFLSGENLTALSDFVHLLATVSLFVAFFILTIIVPISQHYCNLTHYYIYVE